MRIMLFQQDIVPVRNSKGYYKTDESAFSVVLDILTCKQCLVSDSQIFGHHDFASRSIINFLTGQLNHPTYAKLWSCARSGESASCQIIQKGFAWWRLSGLHEAQKYLSYS